MRVVPVAIVAERGRPALSPRDLGALQAEFPGARIDVRAASHACTAVRSHVRIDVGRFWSADFDGYQVGAACEELAARGALALRLEGAGIGAVDVEAVLTRFQRFLARRNPASAGAAFERVLARHRALHDRTKPLVRADLDHALDTWQWLLRLDPGASLAAQVAALFHDVERLASEAEVRIEQHASDYCAFKNEHARRGAAMTRAALASTGLAQPVIERAVELVAGHEQPGRDAERLLLNDADALSFFSLNSDGFLRYYGVEHTRRKIAYTLARLRGGARGRLMRIRYHPDVAASLDEAGVTTHTRQVRHGEREQCKSA